MLVAQSRRAEAAARPTSEERRTADAKAAETEAALAAAEERLSKAVIKAPSDDLVQVIVVEPAEAIVPSHPVLALSAGDVRWFTFNLGKDLSGDIGIGSDVKLLGSVGSWITARVTGLQGQGVPRYRVAPVIGRRQE